MIRALFPLLADRQQKIGERPIETPTLWLGHDLKNPFAVWKHVAGCSGVMVSAFQVFERRWFRDAATQAGVHAALEFDGPVFLDSGGFQLQRNPETSICRRRVVDLGMAIGADVCAVLDYPLDPRVSTPANRQRWAKTLSSTRYTCRRLTPARLAPVLHAYNVKEIEPRMRALRALCTAPAMWCFGSMVPLFHGSYIGRRFARRGSDAGAFERRWVLLTALVREMRRASGKELLHVFGAGSLSTIFLLFLAGVDSVDSASWRLKAAFGAIQLPGLSDRFLGTRQDRSKSRRLLTPACREILSRCSCPECESLNLERRIQNLRRHFIARATHNAHVLISEVTALRDARNVGKMAEFVIQRLADSPSYHAIARDVIMPVIDGSSRDSREC